MEKNFAGEDSMAEKQGLGKPELFFPFKIHFLFLQIGCVMVPSCLPPGGMGPFSGTMSRCFGA